MTRKLSTSRSGQSQSTWPLVLLLVVAVAVPAACVLWFMTEAMRNEQLAVQGRLTAVYQGQLDAIGQRLDDFWTDKEAAIAVLDSDKSAEAIFAELVRSGVADSVIVYDTSGRMAYPRDSSLEVSDPSTNLPAWHQAWALEFQKQDYQAAADAYLSLASEGTPVNRAAHALRSRARCLVKADQKQAALKILIEQLAEPKYRDVIDQQGCLIYPDVQLRALQLLAEPEAVTYQAVLEALVVRLENYGEPRLPAGQRRFLMRQVSEIAPDGPDFTTLGAETLAADYLEYRQSNSQSSDSRHFRHSGFDDVWELTLPDQRAHVICLFTEERIFKELQSIVEADLAIPDAAVKLVPLNRKPTQPVAFLTSPAGEYLADWQLSLWLDDPDPFGLAVNNRIATYLYSGIAVVLAMVALTGLVGRYVVRQLRVTRLRNDLIATVSHELKTPLASNRALIETLLEGRYHDEKQQREYLQLAAKENERLSRLIDSFLAFSRMERNKEAFQFADVEVETVVSAAVDAMGDRFDSPASQLDVEIADDVPAITGDAEALITVLVNLLDNAHKYTENNKHVTLRVHGDNGRVRFEVEDNGIGLSRRAAKKVFDRFHQVDQSLSRRAGGCGLGLSIVQFIIKAHGGTVGVSSQPGQGSTFYVSLPATLSASTQHDDSVEPN